MSVEKREIRHAMRQQRRLLSPGAVAAASAAVCAQVRTLPAYATAVAVLAYLAAENEISVAALIEEVGTSVRGLYLSHCGATPAWVRWRPGEPLVPGPGGVLQPCGVPERPPTPAVALIPVVAWDETGARLGRGGGYYDRIFVERAPGITRVGLAYEFQCYPALPADPWDVPMQCIITERRIIACAETVRARDEPLRKGGVQI